METNRTKKVWILGAVAVLALSGALISLSGGTWENFGEGTWRNALITASVIALVVALTWLPVAFTKRKTTKGSVTPWKKVGKTTLLIWGTLVITTAAAFLSVPFLTGAALSLVQLAMLPSLVAFPIWTVVAALRGNGAPNARPIVSEEIATEGVSAPEALVQAVALDPSLIQKPAANGRSGGKRLLIIAATVVSGVIVLGAAWVGDQWLRSQKLDSVLSTFEKTQNSRDEFYVAIDPFLETSNTDRDSPGHKRLTKAVRDAGGDLSVDLRIMASEMEDINLLPWHSDLADLKSDFSDNIISRILWADHYAMLEAFLTKNPYQTQADATSQIALLTAHGLSIPMFASDATTRIDNLRE